MGTDNLGRDTLSRIIYGTRVSIQAGLVSVGFAAIVGTITGLAAGYWRGWVDDLLMRLCDALWSFPGIVLALAIAAALGPGLVNAMIAIGIVFTPVFARLVRGSALSVRERDFVMAARVLGAGDPRIMRLHILPNVMAPVIVQGSLLVALAIIVEATLSFLGLGVQPPEPSWGSMLKAASQYMQVAPWLSFFPGFAIFFTVLGLNLLGDGFRRALDPRLRTRGES
jgi:peptide/nickel transport system permease protein